MSLMRSFYRTMGQIPTPQESLRSSRGLAGDGAIQRRPAVARAVQLVFAGDVDEVLVARLLRVDLGVQDCRLIVLADRQELAAATEDAAHADEAETALGADAIDSRVV